MGELFIGESMITAHVILVYLIVQNFDGTHNVSNCQHFACQTVEMT